jgi:prophage regulatory protein
MADQIQQALSILRRRQVEARTGLSRSTIYLRISEGTFPKPVSLGGRAVGWVEAEVQDWIGAQIEASREQRAAP